MPQNNLSINIHTFSTEQCRQFFLELFDLDPTLPNVLNYEQRRQLHSVLIAIEPSLAESLWIHVVLCVFPRGSTMNPIKLSEYENYKETQKRIKKDVQWNEFLKLDKKQYLNFRVRKTEEVIKEFNKVNSTFPVSEANFVLRDWLTSYCNSMVDQEKKKRLLKQKNVESTSDQSDTDEISDNAQDSFECHDNINDDMDESVEPNILIPTSSASSHANIGQKNNMPKRKNSATLQPCSTNIKVNDHSTNIKVNDHSTNIKVNDHSTNIKVNDYQKNRNLKNDEPSTVVSEDSQDNTNDEPDALMTATSAFSHADIGQKNTSKLMKNKPKKKKHGPHATMNLENDEDSQGDTNENALEPDALTTASDVLHADIGQENTSTLVKNKLEKKNLTPMQPRNTNIKVNDHQNARNLENDEQSTVILEDNVLPSLRNSLRSSVRKFNNIETISEIIEDDVQDSGKKRKREQKAKKTSSHSARAGKKTKN
ncbi:45450_t:CDS:10 [Gigaspora margarita]|uniref:45450_t:CDS:1 n=1 Tax=Gigaspora margarita TaxID=4874 RepID=A0ABN7UNW0_GIGMA|nr:45450_t:CDS:10 [Gigaspora margarita]